MKRIFLTILMFLGVFTIANAKSYYFNQNAILTGTVRYVTEIDEEEIGLPNPEFYILVLDAPISVLLAEGDEPLGAEEYPVVAKEVHLAESLEPNGKPLKNYVNKKVRVRGELMEAHTAYHKRPVVLWNTKIIN